MFFYNFHFAHNAFSVLITLRRKYSDIVAASVYLFWKYTSEYIFRCTSFIFSDFLRNYII